LIRVCLVLLVCFESATAATLPPWKPGEPVYGFAAEKDIPVRMDDGTVLRADKYFPTAPATGAKAPGRFPVLLVQTPYGKARGLQNLGDYFVRRGYLLVIADLRGFGGSQGQAEWFGARTGRDGVELVQWASRLDEADGKVGLMGCSYLGIIQFFTANSLPHDSPVKAMSAMCIDSNFYRDLVGFGGVPSQLLSSVRALTALGLEDNRTTDPWTQTSISLATGDNAYYNDYWESVNITTFMPGIVARGIPVLTQSGWRDLFPGGNLDVEIAAQNAVQHRQIDQALEVGGRPSGKYQAIVGDWIHGEHMGDSLLPIQLEWFDTWLKGQKTGMADTRLPLHLLVRGLGRWIDSATFPVTDEATSFYLAPGRLSTSACAQCTQELIWAAEGEGTTLSFNSARLEQPLIIAGPGALTLQVQSTRPEIELSATLLDVSPDGSTTQITNGAQLGSHRALNAAGSWYSRDGRLVRPSHFFTKAKSSVVPIGATVRIDIELLPAMYQVPAGHRLRLVVATQPPEAFRQYSPMRLLPNVLTPTPEQLFNLVGGIYTFSLEQSVINLSTAKAADLVPSAVDWGPAD
jgi:predicted acyl esterase